MSYLYFPFYGVLGFNRETSMVCADSLIHCLFITSYTLKFEEQIRHKLYFSSMPFVWGLLGFRTSLSVNLKGVWHEIFDLRFFSWISVPRPPSIPVGPFWIFSKIPGDIREWIFIAGVINCAAVSTTPAKIYRRCQRHRRLKGPAYISLPTPKN